MKNQLLKFSKGNAKLDENEIIIYSLNLPSGFACPSALDCLSKANKKTGKLTDGKDTKFRCFSASQENRFPSLRKQRWHNFDILRKLDLVGMTYMLQSSLPLNAKMVRIHVAGDFFSQTYFDAWMATAIKNPNTIFYAYTKSVNFLVERLGVMPSNFRIVASRGGRFDNLIDKHNLKCAEVVFTIEQAEEMGLEIDHDDSNAYGESKKSFALLIHGTQPAGSKASKALSANRKKGIMGYTRKKKS